MFAGRDVSAQSALKSIEGDDVIKVRENDFVAGKMIDALTGICQAVQTLTGGKATYVAVGRGSLPYADQLGL